MRRTFLLHHRVPTQKFFLMILILSILLLQLPSSWAADSITPSGLNTHVSDPMTVGAHTQYNITGGTRPEGGTNLFHSFGEFGVPTNNIANFLNGASFDPNGNQLPAGLQTFNILARVTGNVRSEIFGTIQTTGFDNANLFLINPNGFLFGPNATVNVGGIMTFTTADDMRLRELDGSNGGIFSADTAQTSILTSAPVAAFGFIGSNPNSIDFNGGQLTITNGTGLALVGGDISLAPDSSVVQNVPSSIIAPGKLIQMTSIAGMGTVPADTGGPEPGMALGTITLGQGTILSTGNPSFGGSSGGAISIRSGQFIATGTQILTGPTVGSIGEGGTVTIAVGDSAILANSTIDTSSVSANGNGGAVSLAASKLTLQDSTIKTFALGNGLTAITGGGGLVDLEGTSSISLMNSTISTETADTAGNAGVVTIAAPTLTIQGGTIATSTSVTLNPFAGNAGDIEITGANVSITDFARLESFASSPETFSRAGTIRIISTENILVANETSILNTTASQANAGNIDMVSKHVTIKGQSVLGSETLGPGRGGSVKITGAENIALESGSIISTNSAFAVEDQGPAGHIQFNTQQLTVTGGSKVSSSTFHNGAGGTITVEDTNSPAQSVLIDGFGSGLYTDTQGTITGGNIVLKATTVTLQNGGTLSAKTSGAEATATGGSITVNATDHVTMTNGASITASSSDPGNANAGDISINAGQSLEMRDSSVTAEATRASGGNIDIQAVDRIRLVNSEISSSVQGDDLTSGGNIMIDPNVVVLQNSQVTAQADRGAGGNIAITTPLFLADSSSLVSASSQRGINGTVTIQSPTSNVSGSLGPLASKPSQAQALLTQRCAALVGGQASSFVVAGREQLPTDPGGWLTSPLAFAELGESRDAGHAVASTPANMAIATQGAGTVSLRRLTPSGFLIANFADSEATGCHS